MVRSMYLPRIAGSEVTHALEAMGAVAIEGPRGCGKTETARRSSASELLFDLVPDKHTAVVPFPALHKRVA